MLIQIPSPGIGVHWVYILVVGLIWIGVNIVIAKYMHRDARRRGIENSDMWLVLGFLFGVFGLLLYIYVRGNYEERFKSK
ncbi:MAG: hypothetical protein ACFFE4_05785 [Candidatus Thorarchaeota archaeon]